MQRPLAAPGQGRAGPEDAPARRSPASDEAAEPRLRAWSLSSSESCCAGPGRKAQQSRVPIPLHGEEFLLTFTLQPVQLLVPLCTFF